jgi:hypothetical protein
MFLDPLLGETGAVADDASDDVEVAWLVADLAEGFSGLSEAGGDGGRDLEAHFVAMRGRDHMQKPAIARREAPVTRWGP